jgi:hypothetical protein
MEWLRSCEWGTKEGSDSMPGDIHGPRLTWGSRGVNRCVWVSTLCSWSLTDPTHTHAGSFVRSMYVPRYLPMYACVPGYSKYRPPAPKTQIPTYS